MSWVTALAGVLRAIPEMAKTLTLINSNIVKMGDLRTELKINEIKREMNEISAKIKEEDDRQKLLDLAERLNNSRL